MFSMIYSNFSIDTRAHCIEISIKGSASGWRNESWWLIIKVMINRLIKVSYSTHEKHKNLWTFIHHKTSLFLFFIIPSALKILIKFSSLKIAQKVCRRDKEIHIRLLLTSHRRDSDFFSTSPRLSNSRCKVNIKKTFLQVQRKKQRKKNARKNQNFRTEWNKNECCCL
jgi:hypothetical protein